MTVAILLNNLRAEGGPALAADLAAEWKDQDPVVFCLNNEATEFSARFEQLGVPVVILGVRDVSPRSTLRIATSVADSLKRHGASAIVSIPNGIHGAIFAGAKFAGVKNRVVHVGNYPWHWRPDFWKYRALMQLSAPLTPDMVCVTDHVAEGVKSHFGHVAKRLHVIRNGIDVDRFCFRGTPRPIVGRPVEIIMVGRLDGGKDHVSLLDAVAMLDAKGVEVRLTIVGDGTLRESLEQHAAPLGQLVRFLGARKDVAELLASADVFAFSVKSEEGLGIALLEAMAVGLPIVASDVGACREVLDEGRCGALVCTADVSALADALQGAGQRPDSFAVGLARLRVEKLYGRKAMAQSYGQLCGFS